MNGAAVEPKHLADDRLHEIKAIVETWFSNTYWFPNLFVLAYYILFLKYILKWKSETLPINLRFSNVRMYFMVNTFGFQPVGWHCHCDILKPKQ